MENNGEEKKMAAEVTVEEVFATLSSSVWKREGLFLVFKKKATDKIHKMVTQIIQILVKQKPYLQCSPPVSAQGQATPYLQNPSILGTVGKQAPRISNHPPNAPASRSSL